MVEIERETFTVTTVGEGQPDYSQPTPATLPTQQALVVSFPEMETAGKRYNDFALINFTATETEYVIGTNARAAKSGSWPATKLAKNLCFYASTACYIRFNESDAVQHHIPSGLIVRFFSRVEKIYVVRETTNGTLHVWIEG